jgi:hypothetical protein
MPMKERVRGTPPTIVGDVQVEDQGHRPCHIHKVYNELYAPTPLTEPGPLITLAVVYYESIKRELNIRIIYECRCDERLKAKAEGSTRLAYTRLSGGLEHLKIETRLIDETFASVMGECEIVTLKVSRLYLELYVKLPS